MAEWQHIFINGESFKVGGRDAIAMRQLADDRVMIARDVKTLSADAKAALVDWAGAGWLQAL